MIIGGTLIGLAGIVPIAIGFGGAGIVAGSAAAAIQSGIGNVVAGSLFARMTSLGMRGVFSTLGRIGTVTAGVGAVIPEAVHNKSSWA